MFEKFVATRPKAPTMKISPKYIFFNTEFCKQIKPPTYVVFKYDKERGILIIEETDEKDPHALKLEPSNALTSGRVQSRQLVKWLTDSGFDLGRYNGQFVSPSSCLFERRQNAC
jgi:hypothetical protein